MSKEWEAEMEIFNLLKNKVQQKQQGVGTFFDNIVIQELQKAWSSENPEDKKSEILQRAKDTLMLSGPKRFVEVHERLKDMAVSDLDGYGRICSQGVRNCLEWKGNPLLKSVQDFAIYQMLIWELRPATIIEIGATSTSLSWFKDLVQLFKLNTRVIGIDKVKPKRIDDEIDFIHGDIKEISDLLPVELLLQFPRPWLVIEDAHVNTLEVVTYITKNLGYGDYIVVEDSISKQSTLLNWIKENSKKQFVVDTKYTDFFGINTTSAANSIITLIKQDG